MSFEDHSYFTIYKNDNIRTVSEYCELPGIPHRFFGFRRQLAVQDLAKMLAIIALFRLAPGIGIIHSPELQIHSSHDPDHFLSELQLFNMFLYTS